VEVDYVSELVPMTLVLRAHVRNTSIDSDDKPKEFERSPLWHSASGVWSVVRTLRPKRVLEFKIEKASVDEAKRQIAKAWAAQTSLLEGLGADERTSQLRELEQVPWTFRYRYECGDAGCKGHSQSIIDWEIAQFYRRVRHSDDWRDHMRKR
jgi:hypothetical protein